MNNATEDNTILNAKYEHKDLANGPWSQRGRGSVNQYRIDFDLKQYRVDGKRAKLDARPDLGMQATETCRDPKRKAVFDISNKASFDHNFQSTTTESPRIGKMLRKSLDAQARKILRVVGGPEEAANTDLNVLSSPTTNTSVHGNSHIGKMNWIYVPSRQNANESDVRPVNASTLTAPKIRFGQQKTNQIKASIKMALKQELV